MDEQLDLDLNKKRSRSRRQRRAYRRSTLRAPPGSLVPIADAHPPVIDIFGFDEHNLEERTQADMAAVKNLRRKWPCLWVNVSGLGDTSVIAALGDLFHLHPLALEDILHLSQMPKYEDYDGSIYMVVPMAELLPADTKNATVTSAPSLSFTFDQLSLFWGRDFVLTFQERPGDVFGAVRDRLRKGIRKRMVHPDYLAYALLDSVVDGYFPVLDLYGDLMDDLEERLLLSPDSVTAQDIHKLKRQMNILRHKIWPMREAIARIHGDSGLVRSETRLFLRDCQDHVIHMLDIIESYKERLSALFDLYMFSVSNKMNEIMKVLTIIATIFMPLSFLTGLYGMNFNTVYPLNMPELNNPYGYPVALMLMFAIFFGMLFFFWRRGWLKNAF